MDKLNNLEVTEEGLSYFRKYIEEMERKEAIVKSEEYINWLCDFINIHKYFSDETWLYKREEISEEDYSNVELISTFFYYIGELADKQFILEESEDGYDTTYYFKVKNKFYEITTIVGQGAITSIKEIEYSSEHLYILIDEEVNSDELKERELVQYIIINKDYIGKIDSAKFGVHIGHACTICALAEQNNSNFKKWYQNGKLQKKIILTASTRKLEKLEKDFYSVRDLGFTEVENGTLLAVSLGIMSRKEAKPFVKGMQLWKEF